MSTLALFHKNPDGFIVVGPHAGIRGDVYMISGDVSPAVEMSSDYKIKKFVAYTTGIETYMIVLPSGGYARTTNGEIFKTSDYSFAKEALQYVEKGDSKTASHRVKSTFGTL